ncbi:MAG TPA: ATP-binding protein [Chloroflexota bacterium]|nr:ATP-binding protein [Chloroflexota bacterium]
MLAELPRVTVHGHSESSASDPGTRADWMALFEELCRVGTDRPMAEVLATIVDTTVSGLRADACSLGLWEPESGEIVICAHADRRRPPEGARFAPGQGVAGWVASTRRPAVISDVASDQRYVILDYPRTSSVLSVPLLWNDDLIGTLTVTSTRKDAFDEDDLRVLGLFATQAASLIVGARRGASDGARAACLELAIGAAPEGIIVCDIDLRLVAFNRAAATALGLRVALGTPAEAWPHPLDLLRSAMNGAVRDGQATSAVALPASTDEASEQAARVTPLLGPDGRSLGAAAIIPGPRGEGLEPAGWSDTALDLAHDLKSPLSSIRGLVTLLMKESGGPITAAQRDLLEHAQAATERLRDTIERILDQTPSRGDETPALQPTALVEVASAVFSRLQGVAASKGVTLESRIPENLPWAQADPFQFARVLENLLDNAVKFSQPGGRVWLDAEATDGWLQCAVSDEGLGIPEWALERIFERHFRAPFTVTEHPGSGLGLAICQRIVEQHGGRIWAESLEGHGATIRFTLPIIAP